MFENLSTWVEIFHEIEFFFKYRVEISARDENLHIISPQRCEIRNY